MLARYALRLRLPARPARQLHAGARLRYATPSGLPTPEELMANPATRKVFERVGQHPTVVAAVVAVAEVLKKHGIDANSGQRPGMKEMAKLLMDKEFREASLKLKEEMDKAGIDIKEDFSTIMGAPAGESGGKSDK